MNNRNVKKTKTLIRLLKDLTSTDKQENKEALIRFFPYKKLLKVVFKNVYDPSIIFNFEQDRLLFIQNNVSTKRIMFNSDERLKELLKFLRSIKNKRILDSDYEKLRSILSMSNPIELELLLKIINKNLNIGLSGFLLKKLFPNIIQYPTRFMTCLKYDPRYEIEFPVVVEPKEFGVRIKMICSVNSDFKVYTKFFQNVTPMFSNYELPLLRVSEKLKSTIEVDGIFLYKNIKKTVGLIDKINNLKPINLPNDYTFRITDFVIKSFPNQVLLNRKKNVVKITSMLIDSGISQVKPIPFKEVDNKNDILKACVNSINMGNKGIILKDPNSIYTYNRDSMWLSYENANYERGEIVELIRDRDTPTRCASLVVRTNCGVEKLVSNICDSLRETLINEKDKIVGLSCMVELSEINRLHKIYYYKGLTI